MRTSPAPQDGLTVPSAPRRAHPSSPPAERGSQLGQRGSVLIIVLWIAFGLVVLALYFANSMNMEMRASDNRVCAQAADQAIDGAVRYISYILTTQASNGSNGILPDPSTYVNQAVTVGDAKFWLIGRDTNIPTGPGKMSFGLIDEASKIHLNFVSSNQLFWLPNMTVDLTTAILDWRDTNGTGPTVSYYAMQQPPYLCKSDSFETVDEVRLVYGADMDILVGEDVNRNGILDPDETDANQNNMVDPGILEHLTVYSMEPSTNADGSAKVNIANLSDATAQAGLLALLTTNISASRATAIMTALGVTSGAAGGGGGGGRGGGAATVVTTGGGRGGAASTAPIYTNTLAFYIRSGMTSTEFAPIATNLTTSTNVMQGRVNVNTASLATFTALCAGDPSAAQTLVSYRLSNPLNLTSIAWVSDALGQSFPDALAALEAGLDLTTQSFQFTADVAAVGPYGRGYRRVKFIIDTMSGAAQVIYRQDLTHLGWALGKEVREKYVLANNSH